MSEASSSRRLRTAAYFGRLAASYGSGEYYRKRREAVSAELRRALGGIGRLLDLGCGNGYYLAEFGNLPGCHLAAGGDFSREMLDEARRRLDHARTPALVCCDAMVLPFRSHSWDAIFCSHVLQIVEDVRQCLSEIVRCLSPRGLLIVAGGVGGARGQIGARIGNEWWSELRRMFPRPTRTRSSREPGELRSACESIGFTVEIKEARFMATGADLAEMYRIRWMPLVASAERAAAEQILGRVEHEYGATKIEMTETLLVGSRGSN